MLPLFFIAHGVPLLALENNHYTRFLQTLPRTGPRSRGQQSSFPHTGHLMNKRSANWSNTAQFMTSSGFRKSFTKSGTLPKGMPESQMKLKGCSMNAESPAGRRKNASWTTERGLSFVFCIRIPIFRLFPCPLIRKSRRNRLTRSEKHCPH